MSKLNYVKDEHSSWRLMLQMSSVISVSSEVMSGTPVFSGTRVPIDTFFDYLKAGDSIDDFLDGFPSVDRHQVVSLLEEMSKHLAAMVA